MNFIECHIIDQISKMISETNSKFNHYHFYYFNEPIIHNGIRLDRFKWFNLYCEDEILPVGLTILDGKTLLEFYNKLKNNEFYIKNRKNDKR